MPAVARGESLIHPSTAEILKPFGLNLDGIGTYDAQPGETVIEAFNEAFDAVSGQSDDEAILRVVRLGRTTVNLERFPGRTEPFDKVEGSPAVEAGPDRRLSVHGRTKITSITRLVDRSFTLRTQHAQHLSEQGKQVGDFNLFDLKFGVALPVLPDLERFGLGRHDGARILNCPGLQDPAFWPQEHRQMGGVSIRLLAHLAANPELIEDVRPDAASLLNRVR